MGTVQASRQRFEDQYGPLRYKLGAGDSLGESALSAAMVTGAELDKEFERTGYSQGSEFRSRSPMASDRTGRPMQSARGGIQDNETNDSRPVLLKGEEGATLKAVGGVLVVVYMTRRAFDRILSERMHLIPLNSAPVKFALDTAPENRCVIRWLISAGRQRPVERLRGRDRRLCWGWIAL